MLDKIAELNSMHYDEMQDSEIQSRIAQYEMAYRMQMSVPEVMNLNDEPESVIKLYGAEALIPGTYAANALLARRLAENGVRFIQLYHQGWDQHGNLPNEMEKQAKDVDQASAALVLDLKQRGLLEDTLVIWEVSLGGQITARGGSGPIITDVIIIPEALASGWPVVVLNRVSPMVKLMSLDTTLSKIRYIFMIFMLHFYIFWGLITNSSLINTRGAGSG
jgi:predicted AlkP superfamily pyrophosphatase or phosphodiesterase